MSYNYPPQPRHYSPEAHPYPDISPRDSPQALPIPIPGPQRRASFSGSVEGDGRSYYRSPSQMRSPTSYHRETISPERHHAEEHRSPRSRHPADLPSTFAGESQSEHHHYHQEHRRYRPRAPSMHESSGRRDVDMRSREYHDGSAHHGGFQPILSHHMSLPRHINRDFGSLPPQLAVGLGMEGPPSMMGPQPTMRPMMMPQDPSHTMDYTTFSALAGNNVRMNPFATPHTAYPNAMPLSNSIDIPPVMGYGSQRYPSFAKPGKPFILP